MNPNYNTILFTGYGRVGKDEAAIFLGRITQLPYAGSFSWAGLPHMAKVLGVHPCQAWEERRKNRQFWKDELDRLRLDDPTLLARLALATGSVAAGLRDVVELEAVKAAGLFDRIVWVERAGTPIDPTVTYTADHCHEVLVNPGPYGEDTPENLAKYHDVLFEWAVDNHLPLKRTDETVALLRRSKFYMWSGENRALSDFLRAPEPQPAPFVPILFKRIGEQVP